jgi:hypothetical protein
VKAIHKMIQRHDENIIEMKLSKSWRDRPDGQSVGRYARDAPRRFSKVDSQSSEGSMAQLWLSAGCRI